MPAAGTIALLCALLALSMPGCTGNIRNKSYRNNKTAIVAADKSARTNDSIEKNATYASYFRLSKDVDTIKIGVILEYVSDILGTKKTRNVYFIVEKVIDMTKLKNPRLTSLHAELGRNFDNDWNRDADITLVSDREQPFKTLDAGSLYRVRYTTFAEENYTFIVTVKADCDITFVEAPK
jgi:hypothetical protein